MSRPVEYNRSENARRKFTSRGYRSAMGRSSVTITCPFCATDFTAYLWSIAGGGKKCPKCGAIHASFGYAYPVAGKEPA